MEINGNESAEQKIVVEINSVSTRYIDPLPAGTALPSIMIGAVVDVKMVGKKLDIDFIHVKSYNIGAANHDSDLKSAIKNMLTNPGQGGGKERTKKMRLAIKYPTYIAILLSSNTDWQFMANEPPFTVPQRGNVGSFYDALKYELNGGQPVISSGQDGVRLAVVKYYPSSLTRFVDRFNINTEFWLKDHQNEDQKLPIIIDPEVGWPEGTKP
jgi:hypothetical protein